MYPRAQDYSCILFLLMFTMWLTVPTLFHLPLGLETKDARINAMRSAISETFPEPNRRLLQRLVFSFFCHSNILKHWITSSVYFFG
jgi:hypothetical protein